MTQLYRKLPSLKKKLYIIIILSIIFCRVSYGFMFNFKTSLPKTPPDSPHSFSPASLRGACRARPRRKLRKVGCPIGGACVVKLGSGSSCSAAWNCEALEFKVGIMDVMDVMCEVFGIHTIPKLRIW